MSFFNEIEKELNDVDVIKLEYAGHGGRRKESFYENFDELARDMFQKVKNQISGEYSLLGYSMGSISLVEVLRLIIRENVVFPKHVFLAAHKPCVKAELTDYSEAEMDELVKQRTIKFGDVPERLLNNNTFWRMYLPLYRADYSIIGKYKFGSLDLRTTIPATIFYSESDTPLADMLQWKKYFVGDVDFQKYEGSHFFIREHYHEMAEVIKEKLGVKYDI
mgnify:CR=1 FL=1